VFVWLRQCTISVGRPGEMLESLTAP
jgi:hypothetical protein